MTTIDDILGEGEGVLTPIACPLCESSFVTYIEFDLVMHLHEVHGIGRGYLDTPPTPSTPSRSWSDDFRIIDAIKEGKELGVELNDETLERLDLNYSKPLEPTNNRTSKQETSLYRGPRVIPWSQVAKPFDFISIVPVDEFFRDDPDKPYSPLKNHTLQQSPCYPILGIIPAGKSSLYYCEICSPEHANYQVVGSIYLDSVEHHCRYKDPDRHKAEILNRLTQNDLSNNQVIIK